MVTITEVVRAGLVPFLAVTGLVLAAVVCHVVILHGVRELAFRRRARLITLYRPVVELALQADATTNAFDRLRSAPRRHHAVIASLILEPLRVAEGPITDRARAAAGALGLVARWRTALSDRRWWIRADATHALGLVGSKPSIGDLITALDDPYDEVRAAAVEALGLIADPAAIPDLVARLGQQSRHQRVRLVRALQRFGSTAAAPLVAHARDEGSDRVSIAELLGTIGATSALDQLIEWASDEDPALRTAALKALGTIGIDDRAYYHVLRKLNDEVDEVRAMAAWALGRSGRDDAASYLAPRLSDTWIVAAQAARALRDLGIAGRRVLEIAAAQEHGDMARQMLWEWAVSSGHALTAAGRAVSGSSDRTKADAVRAERSGANVPDAFAAPVSPSTV